jgi:hypothetical protein
VPSTNCHCRSMSAASTASPRSTRRTSAAASLSRATRVGMASALATNSFWNSALNGSSRMSHRNRQNAVAIAAACFSFAVCFGCHSIPRVDHLRRRVRISRRAEGRRVAGRRRARRCRARARVPGQCSVDHRGRSGRGHRQGIRDRPCGRSPSGAHTSSAGCERIKKCAENRAERL